MAFETVASAQSAVAAAHRETKTRHCDSHISVRYVNMNGHEFERQLKRIGRRRGTSVLFDGSQGKGSHGRLYYGDRFTTLKDRRKEIGPGLLKAMLDQLGLTKSDLENG